MSLSYLRTSNKIMILNIHPIIVMILSHFVLAENFFLHILMELLCVFLGVFLNEKQVNMENINF